MCSYIDMRAYPVISATAGFSVDVLWLNATAGVTETESQGVYIRTILYTSVLKAVSVALPACYGHPLARPKSTTCQVDHFSRVSTSCILPAPTSSYCHRNYQRHYAVPTVGSRAMKLCCQLYCCQSIYASTPRGNTSITFLQSTLVHILAHKPRDALSLGNGS